MDGYSDGGNDDAYGDDGGYGDNIPTRDFLSRPATFSSAAPYNPNAFGMPSSSSLNPSRLDFGGLDLNSGSDWAAMLGYEDLLRSGGVDGSHGPPPVRVPGRSGRGTLGLRGARGGRGRGGSASAGSGSAFAGGFVSPTPTGRGASSRGTRGGRRRGGRRRVGEDNNRCHWTPEHTKLFCVLYCEQIDNGNCTRGHMSKAGWKEISERFYAATDLLHDSEQFGSRYRGLKKVWRFIDEKLRKGSGLGRREDQSVLASDAWWTDKTGGNKELMALKDGWPCYLEEMDKMFTGYVADGSTSYAPGQSNPIEHIVSDEDEEAEEEEDEDDVLTPLSIGSKRSSSSRSTHSLRSTATSPKKKLKSPAVKAMVGEIRGMRNEIADGRVFYQGVVNCRRAEREAAREAAKQEEKEKLKQEEERRQLIMRLARECGVNESSPTWIGVLKLMKDETGISFFFASDNVGKRTTIEYYARADVAASTVADDSDDEEEYGEADDSDDEFDRLLLANLMQEEAAAAAAMYGMSAVAMHLDKYCNRSEFREVGPGLSGLEWVERKLGNPTACYKMFRMTPTMFYRLHDMLCNNYGLQSSEKSSSIEALGMFLWMVGAPQSVRQAEDRFERSLGTVHSFFYKVLNCLRRLADDIIKPRDPQFRTMHTRLDNPRFYPFFKDCIGAIDGTHIPCVVSKDLVVQYMCRKNITTQNVMACCDFDLIFTFVLAGWPGSVHDMRVFNDAMNKYTDVFPHPPPGKYYLVDSGYANRPGYLAPYRGTKYHLQEYQNAEEPQGKEELFNYAHSSLRNCIERSFGVLKQKWRILMHLPSYPIETQTHIIVACMALHNFIRLSGLRDRHFGRCDRDPRYVPSVASVDQPPTEQAPTILDSRQMNEFRDSIALQMLEGSL